MAEQFCFLALCARERIRLAGKALCRFALHRVSLQLRLREQQ